jgi:RNA polymerase sigma factor (sigma-70 family)
VDAREASSTRPEVIAPLSFQRVYNAHFRDVRRWVRGLGARPSDVDDLVQEVFLVAYRRLADFEGNNLEGWLYRIASRKVRDARQALWFRHYYSDRTHVRLDEVATDGRTPCDEVEILQQIKRLERALGRLNSVQRTALVLFGIEGYSGEQVAKFQGISINTVWSRIFKARHNLQMRLARSGHW